MTHPCGEAVIIASTHAPSLQLFGARLGTIGLHHAIATPESRRGKAKSRFRSENRGQDRGGREEFTSDLSPEGQRRHLDSISQQSQRPDYLDETDPRGRRFASVVTYVTGSGDLDIIRLNGLRCQSSIRTGYPKTFNQRHG